MSAMKITFLLAIAGHLLCGVCDCLMHSHCDCQKVRRNFDET